MRHFNALQYFVLLIDILFPFVHSSLVRPKYLSYRLGQVYRWEPWAAPVALTSPPPPLAMFLLSFKEWDRSDLWIFPFCRMIWIAALYISLDHHKQGSGRTRETCPLRSSHHQRMQIQSPAWRFHRVDRCDLRLMICTIQVSTGQEVRAYDLR
jgi:hypothetical protein